MAINQGPYTTGGQLTAAEFTSIISETNPVITSSGQTINESDNNQMAISHAISGSKGDFYQEASGSAADVYVLEGSDSQQQIHQLRDGMRIRFRVTNANTGSSTINVNSLGAVTAKLNGSNLSGGELVAGEIVEFVYKQSSNEFDLIVDSGGVARPGEVVQVVNFQTGATSTGNTIIPVDNTIPQNTEGDEYMTLAITPTSATNNLKIDIVANYTDTGGNNSSAALFQDSTADALAAQFKSQAAAVNRGRVFSFTHFMVSGTTSSTTFKLRIGPDDGSTVTFNGASGAGIFGGVIASSITITEIQT